MVADIAAMIWVDLAILLVCILWGARLGGIGLGTVAANGYGLLFMIFAFGRAPGSLPGEVLLTVSFGRDGSGGVAGGGWSGPDGASRGEGAASPSPAHYLRGATDFIFFHLCLRNGPRSLLAAADHRGGFPQSEGAPGAAAVDLRHRVTGRGYEQPLSAATAAMVALLSSSGSFGLKDVLIVCIPSTLAGVIAGAISVFKMGKELEQDPAYLQRLASGELAKDTEVSTGLAVTPQGAASSVLLFLGAAMLITLLGLVPGLRPDFTANGRMEKLSMVFSISLVTLAATALIMAVSKAKPDKIVSSSVMRAGVVAVISISGSPGWD